MRAVWRAHRASPDFPRFAAAHPSYAPDLPPEAFERLSYTDYGVLYTHAAIGEDHLDDGLWPAPYPARFLGLTDRQAGWLYAATFVLSAWLIYQVYAGLYAWEILVLIPLFLAFAYARFRQGRVRQTSLEITPRATELALQEARSARTLASYETSARRRRRIILQRWRPRSP